MLTFFEQIKYYLEFWSNYDISYAHSWLDVVLRNTLQERFTVHRTSSGITDHSCTIVHNCLSG